MAIDYLLVIIKAILNNNKLEKNSKICNEQLYQLAKFHSLEHLLYYQIHLFDDEVIIKEIKKSYQLQIQKAAILDAELETICETLEKEKVKHLVLKGSIIKHLYSSFEMRSMSDLDILYEVNDRKKISNIFKELGYSQKDKGSDSHHDVYMKRPFMNVEMHKQMIDDVFDWAKYYATIWDNVILKPDKNYEYYLSNEDFYIFHICHAGKHFQNGGTGVRTIIDEYLFLKKYNNLLNWDYINLELAKLNLTLFEKNIKNLSRYWFSDDTNFTQEEILFLKELTNFIAKSGTYGTSKQYMIQQGFVSSDMLETISKSRFKYLINKLFPSYSQMKRKFTILKKWPILLPIFWIWRIIRSIFRKNHNVFNQMHTLTSIKEEEIKRYQELREKTGI